MPRPSAEEVLKAPDRSGAAAGEPSRSLVLHSSRVLRPEGARERRPLGAALHVSGDVRRAGEVGVREEDGHVVQIRTDCHVGYGELSTDEPLGAAEHLLQDRDGAEARLVHRSASHAVVARDGAEAEPVQLRVAPNHPLGVLGPLLRGGRAAVLVGEVEQDRARFEDLDAAIVGQERHLPERMVAGPRRRHPQIDAGLGGVPVDEGRPALLGAVQREPHVWPGCACSSSSVCGCLGAW
mmetsp:Transcript_42363/g.119801  ORF Transcript_42363/g.119801 Transcript_42363/m.119801 type:complete len:238 (+) Transcript_42363:138-851(+)